MIRAFLFVTLLTSNAFAQASQPALPQVRYNDFAATQSPITQSLAQYWRAFAAAHPKKHGVFAKLGDSLSANLAYLTCFGPRHRPQLGANAELARTLRFFSTPLASGDTSFDRASTATKVSEDAPWLLTHNGHELAALEPQFATVTIGTNDLNFGGAASAIGPQFWRTTQAQLFFLVDNSLAAGVIPMLSTIPLRRDRANEVSTYNAIVRSVAQARQIPFIDVARGLSLLPNAGVGPDGVHLTQYPGGACDLSSRGLQYGYNARNRLTLTALDRWSRALFAKDATFDPEPAPLAGKGSIASPLIIDRLPFSDARALSATAYKDIGQYSCAQPQPGSEFVYELNLAKPTPVRILVLGKSSQITCRSKGFECEGASDVTANLLQGRPSGDACVASGNTVVQKGLTAGKYYITVDTSWVGGDPMVDDYMIVVTKCDDGDPRCL